MHHNRVLCIHIRGVKKINQKVLDYCCRIYYTCGDKNIKQ